MSKGLGTNQPIFFNAIVEDRNDPLQLGRVRVRVFGIHSDSVADIPSNKLPWAPIVLPSNNASTSGIGWSPTGIVPGTQVLVYFADGTDFQKPVVIGTIPGTNAFTSHPTTDSNSVVVMPSPAQETQTTSSAATTAATSSWTLGQTSEQFETRGGASAGFISTGVGDLGDKSYGPWQLSLNAGTLKDYVKNFSAYSTKFVGMTIGSPEFDNTWKALGSGSDGAAFKADQRSFIQNTHYAILLRKSSSLGLSDRGNGVQDCVWSVAVQYGPGTSILSEALSGKQIAVLTDSDVVTLIQTHRKNTVKTKFKSSPDLWDGLEARADREKTALLALCEDSTTTASKQVEAPAAKDVYGQDMYKPVNTAKPVTTSSKISFRDPSGKYPTKLYKGAIDTNRLARNYKSNTTIVKSKQNSVIKGNGFVEPVTRYSAIYPFNKVFESESGHVMEFDDTDGAERIHIYHRAGTFIEFHPDGTIVRKSAKDDIEVVVANKSVFVAGDCNVVIEGDKNVKVLGNVNYQVQQNIDFKAGGNISMMCNGEMILSAAKTARFQGGVSASVESPSVALTTGTAMPVILDLSSKIQAMINLSDEDIPQGSEDDSMQFTTDVNAPDLPAIDPLATTTKAVVAETPATTNEAALGNLFSKYYTAADFSTNVALPAQRNAIVDQCGLTIAEITANLQTLARNCIDPIADRFGKGSFIITNGFRLSNGTSSHHLSGCAADLQFPGLAVSQIPIIAEQIRRVLPAFTQMIIEYHGANPVIHIGYAKTQANSPFSRLTGNVKDVFTTYDTKFTRFKTPAGMGGFFDKNRNLIYSAQ